MTTCGRSLADVFELGTTVDFDKVSSNCPFYVIFSGNRFPRVKGSLIRELRDLGDDRAAMLRFFSQLDFRFPLITKTISEIAETAQDNVENQYYSSMFLLYSFVAWYINLAKTGRAYPFRIVLMGLIGIRDERLRSVALSAAFIGLRESFKGKDIQAFNEYFEVMTRFFEVTESDLPNDAGSLFLVIIERLADYKHELEMVWELLIRVAKRSNNVLNAATAEALLDVTLPQIFVDGKCLLERSAMLLLYVDQSKYRNLFVMLCACIVAWSKDEGDECKMPEHVEVPVDLSEAPLIKGRANAFKVDPKIADVSEEIDDRFDGYKSIVSAVSPDFAHNFVELIIGDIDQLRSNGDERILNAIEFLFFALKEMKCDINFEDMGIFAPDKTVFTEMTKDFSRVRNRALQVIGLNEDFFESFLLNAKVYPRLFAEIVYRMITLDMKVSCMAMSELFIYYKTVETRTTEEEEAVALARNALLATMEHSKDVMFQDDTFVINCFGEECLQDYLLASLVGYFSKGNVQSEAPLIALSRIICDLNVHEYPGLMTKVLTAVAEILKVRRCGALVKPMFSHVARFLTSVRSREGILNGFLECLRLAGPECEISEDEVSLIMASPRFTECSDVGKLFRSLCSCVSCDNGTITNPGLIRALYLLKSDDMPSFLLPLLDRTENAVICHTHGVDAHLITWIKQSSDHEDVETVKSLLCIFEKIAKVISSVDVAKSFMQLLAPRESGVLVDTEDDMLEMLSRITSFECRLPSFRSLGNVRTSAALAIDGDPIMFTGWILYTDTEMECHQIFRIEGSELNYISVCLSGGEWNVMISWNGKEQRHVFNVGMLEKHWNLIIVTISCDKLSLTENLDTAHEMKLSICQQGTYVVTLGSGDTIETANMAGYLTVSLFSFVGDLEREQVFWSGPAAQPPPMTCLATNATNHIKEHKGLVLTIIDKYDFDAFVPLFSLLDKKCANGSFCEHAMSVALNVMEKTLLFDVKVQRQFINNKTVSMIAHLLAASDDKWITFDLYLRLFAMYRCLVDPQLREEFLDHILMNNAIWNRLRGIEIVQHWNDILFQCSKPSMLMVRPFWRLIHDINVYYNYEGDRIECRDVLLDMAVKIGHLMFNRNDMNALINECITVNDDRVTHELLLLLDRIGFDQCVKKTMAKLGVDTITRLAKLTGNGGINFGVLRTLMELYEKEILPSRTLPEFVQLTIMEIPKCKVVDFVSKMVAEASRSSPHLLSIACWYVAVVDESAQDELFAYLDENGFPDICNNILTMFWPVILGIKSERMIDYMLAQVGDKWEWLMPYVEIAAVVAGLDVAHAQIHITSALFRKLKNTREDLRFFFATAIFTLMFQRDQFTNFGLREMMRRSPFASDDVANGQEDNLDANGLENVTIWDISHYTGLYRVSYGLRVNKDMEWQDAAFVKELLDWLGDDLSEFEPTKTMLLCLVTRSGQHSCTGTDAVSNMVERSMENIRVLTDSYVITRTKWIPQIKADVLTLQLSETAYTTPDNQVPVDSRLSWDDLCTRLTHEGIWNAV